MNFNILSYFIYGFITIYIIVWVGKQFHSNGRIFILKLFHQNEPMADTTNNLLLMLYYLFNIGYAIMRFSLWRMISCIDEMISTIATKTGTLIIILAVTHYCNIGLIYFLSAKNHSLITSKKHQL